MDPYNVSVINNGTLSSYVEIKQLTVIKLLKILIFTDEIQSVIGYRTCLMIVTMKI